MPQAFEQLLIWVDNELNILHPQMDSSCQQTEISHIKL